MKELIKKKDLQNGLLLGLRTLNNTVRVVVFLLVAAILLHTWIIWFNPKHFDGNRMMESFYAQPENSIDLLVVGSSHTFIDVNTGMLWEDFGVPSFVIGGSLQPFWCSYYYIREALNYQTPDLIVLEALACDLDTDYGDHGMIINNVSGMRMGRNKLEAIRTCVTDTDGIIDLSLLFREYHNRYSDLDIIDIAPEFGDPVRYENNKGFYDYLGTTSITRPDCEMDDTVVPMPNKEEYYYRLIIEYCQEQGIPLMIMVSPDGWYNDLSRGHYNYAREIAEEYGVEFIDYNEYYDEIGIDFQNDFGDIGHLNYLGNRKFTSVLGEHLVDEYNLTDRRGDTTGLYDSWHENYLMLESRVDNYLLSKCLGTGAYLRMLNELNDNYEIIIYISDYRKSSYDMRRYLGLHSISTSRPFDSSRYIIQGDVTRTLEADDNGLYYEEYLGDHHLSVTNEGIYFDSVRVDESEYAGVCIVTIDTYNQVLVDSVLAKEHDVYRNED